MNLEDFLSKQAESERRIRRRVLPMGLIYAIQLASIFCAVVLVVILWVNFATDARNTILLALGICVLLFAAGFPLGRDSRKQFAKLGLKCPSCHNYLVFIDGRKTAETGRCPHCGVQIFEK
jgi:hypothetical protein